MKRWNALMLRCLIALSFAGSYHAAIAVEFEPSDLVGYYNQLTGHFIIPNSNYISSHPDSLFVVNHGFRLFPWGKREYDLEFSQNFFKLDAEAFIRHLGASDFADAKFRFYSRLFFSNRKQHHLMPYYTMSGWLSLNHPPVRTLELPLERYTNRFSEQFPEPEQSRYFDPEFQKTLDHDTQTELTFGNELKPLMNDQAIREKIRLVKEAKRYVLGAVMFFACDESSEEFVQALIDQAQKGVRVTYMMEKFYNNSIYKKCTKRLREGGVDVVLVTDKFKLKTFLSFFHAKYLVRDGEEVIQGGQNIVSFENRSTGYNQLNRDTDLLMKGPSATDFVSEYIDLWEKHRGRNNQSLEDLRKEAEEAKTLQRLTGQRGESHYLEKLSDPSTRMKGACRVIVQGPYRENRSYALALRRYVEASEKLIFLTSPEIAFSKSMSKSGEPDETLESDLLIDALKKAAFRNIPVELISNGIDGGDGELSAGMRVALARTKDRGQFIRHRMLRNLLKFEPQHFARAHRNFMKTLQKTPGIRTWAHFTYMHAKQAYFDRIATSISSYNLDKPSGDRNTESGAICLDETLAKTMERQLTLDLINSVPIISSNEYPEPESELDSVSEEMELSSQE